MHPGRAERLAALLDDAAEFAQAFPDLSGEHVDGQPCGDYACRMVTRLRHLARDLNGTTRAATTPAPSAPEAPQAALNATETGEHPGPRVTGS